MAKSPVSILHDESGNPVGVVLDGAVYRLRAESKLVAGSSHVEMAVVDDTAIPAGTRALLVAGMDTASKSQFVLIDLRGGLVSIDSAHHKVHEGKHFYTCDWISVSGAGTSFDLFFKTNGSFPHFKYEMTAQAAFSFEMFEAPTTSADGTALPIFNNNRNSATVPVMTAFSSPTVTATGTSIHRAQLTSGQRTGGSASREDELILKTATSYLLRFTKTDAGSANVSWSLMWYE